MKRNFKLIDYEFRGIKIDNRTGKRTGEWVYGGYAPSILPNETAFISFVTEKLECRDAQVDRYTVGQYTGKKDKSRVKIFEGDIVKDDRGNIGVVMYSERFLDWRIFFYRGRNDLIDKYGQNIFSWIYPKMTLKVIGNIHDNPELLDRKPNA
jgi:uncharacterized phage protein (TIGR01671 family)